MRSWPRWGVAWAIVTCWCWAAAQPTLQVNGAAVAGISTTLVPGLAYAPAGDLARALGADVAVDVGGARVTLTLGAAIVQIALVTDAAAAERHDPALLRDGAPRAGPAAVWTGVEAFLPVKATGEALGGRVSFLPESGTVAVVLPRPRLTMRVEGAGSSQRLVFGLDAPARFTTFESAASGVLELRFERADPVAVDGVDGQAFVRAALASVRGTAEARVQLAPGGAPRVYAVPAGRGMEVVVAFGPTPTPTPIVSGLRARWILDAGHAPNEGASLLAGVEGELTRAFVDRLEGELARAGLELVRTRPGPAPVPLEERTALGVGADAFVSVHLGDLPRGRVRLYVLDDAEGFETLDRAVRWNAESAVARPETDGVRRAVLLRLLPDLTRGRAWAQALAGRLVAAGWSVDGPVGAPVAVLAGAAGRGVLVEMSADDLRDPAASARLAAALVETWAPLDAR